MQTKNPRNKKILSRKFTISDDDPFAKIFDKKAFEEKLAEPEKPKRKKPKAPLTGEKKNVKFDSDDESD